MRDWSKIPTKSPLGWLLRLPLKLIPKNACMQVRSGINRGMKWIVGSSIHGCWLGGYEADKQALVKKLVQPEMNVLDIGANAGFYTLAFSRLVGSNGHVWAFEPFAQNVTNLLRHVNMNHLANVTVMQMAASAEAGIAGFQVGERCETGSLGDNATYQVPTVSLDDLLNSKAFPPPDLIKMDVEGAESLVLEGSKNTMSQYKPKMVIALHGKEQMKKCRHILESSGYKIFLLDGSELGSNELLEDEIYALPR